jgi:hypothetical protein
MKWSHFETVENSQKLLYWVLMYVLTPYFDDPIDHWLKKIMVTGGGIGGDPGWEMENIPEGDGGETFYVWADSSVSGIEPASASYKKEVVEKAIFDSLCALSESHPERKNEIRNIIAQYVQTH